jgi:hypothetical protein
MEGRLGLHLDTSIGKDLTLFDSFFVFQYGHYRQEILRSFCRLPFCTSKGSASQTMCLPFLHSVTVGSAY